MGVYSKFSVHDSIFDIPTVRNSAFDIPVIRYFKNFCKWCAEIWSYDWTRV